MEDDELNVDPHYFDIRERYGAMCLKESLLMMKNYTKCPWINSKESFWMSLIMIWYG
jgi:hypothetical protein